MRFYEKVRTKKTLSRKNSTNGRRSFQTKTKCHNMYVEIVFLGVTSFNVKLFCHSKLVKDTIAEKIRLVEVKTDELIKHCQEELLRKKNSIIDNLNSAKVSFVENINENPRLWRNEEFQFQLTNELNQTQVDSIEEQVSQLKEYNQIFSDNNIMKDFIDSRVKGPGTAIWLAIQEAVRAGLGVPKQADTEAKAAEAKVLSASATILKTICFT